MASPKRNPDLQVGQVGSTPVTDSGPRSFEPFVTKVSAGKCPYCGATTVIHSEEWDDGWVYTERACTCGYVEVI